MPGHTARLPWESKQKGSKTCSGYDMSIPKSTQAFLKSLFYSTMTKTYQDSIPSHPSILVNFLVPKSIAGETLSPPAGGCHGVDEGQKNQTAGDVT